MRSGTADRAQSLTPGYRAYPWLGAEPGAVASVVPSANERFLRRVFRCVMVEETASLAESNGVELPPVPGPKC